MVKLVNENTIDDLLALQTEIEAKAFRICSPKSNHSVSVKLLMRNVTTHEINLIQDAIQTKAKFGNLKPLEELEKDEPDLLKIFEIE